MKFNHHVRPVIAKTLFGALLCAVAIAQPVWAQDTATTTNSNSDTNYPPAIIGITQIHELVIKYPLPDWIVPGDQQAVLAQSQYRRQGDQNVMVIEQIPSDENFIDFSNMYMITADKGLFTELTHSVSSLIAAFGTRCQSGEFSPIATSPGPNVALLTLTCGALVQPEFNGRGSVVHARIDFVDGIGITIAREWRGQGFSVALSDDEVELPVEAAEFELISHRFFNDIEVVRAATAAD